MTNTTAQLAAARIREALEEYDACTNYEQEAKASRRLDSVANPEALRALLAERDELAKDAARYDALKHAPTEMIRGLLTAAPGHWDGIADAILTNKD